MLYSPPTYVLIAWSLLALASCDGLPKNTYWVDITCTQRPHWNEYINEAFNMAQISSRRLFHAGQLQKPDTDYANVYEWIFHRTISDQKTYDRVQGVIGGIANQWKETQSLVDSNLRIYYRRWAKLGDRHYIDEDNLMLSDKRGDCMYRGILGYMMGHTTLKPDTNSPYYTNSKTEPRAVMTLCEEVFGDYVHGVMDRDAPKMFGEIPATVDLGGVEIENFSTMVSVTILHEFTHFPLYKTEDIGPGKGYGWKNIMALNSENSLNNAESHAYMMLWGGLAERGYTLPRRINAEGSVDGINLIRAKEGILALYRDITR